MYKYILGENNQVQADDDQMEQDGNEAPITLTWEEYRRITNLCVHKLRLSGHIHIFNLIVFQTRRKHCRSQG